MDTLLEFIEGAMGQLKGGKPANLTKCHRFENFRSRISKIKITSKKIGNLPILGCGDDQADFTFFKKALGHWSEFNSTSDFRDFRKELGYKGDSLASIIFYKNDIVTLLEKSLSVENTKAYEPLIDLTVNLTRDLEEELNDDLPRLLAAILSALRSEDLEVAECVFTGIARLVKCIPRSCIGDQIHLFSIMKTYLFSGPIHVRKSASEALGYIFRRWFKHDHKECFFAIIDQSQTYSIENGVSAATMAETLGFLMFEIFRQAGGGLSSLTIEILSAIIDDYTKNNHEEDDSKSIMYMTLRNLFTILVLNSNQFSSNSLIRLLITKASQIEMAIIDKSQRSQTLITIFRNLLSFIQIFASLCSDTNWSISYHTELCKISQSFMCVVEPDFRNMEVHSRYLVSIIEVISEEEAKEFLLSITTMDYETSGPETYLMGFFELANISNLYTKKIWIYKIFFLFMKKMWLKNKSLCLFMLQTHNIPSDDVGVDTLSLMANILTYVKEYLSGKSIMDDQNLKALNLPITAVHVLSHHANSNFTEFSHICRGIIFSIYSKILSCDNDHNSKSNSQDGALFVKHLLIYYLSNVIESLVICHKHKNSRDNLQELEIIIFDKMLHLFYNNKAFIRVVALYVEAFGIQYMGPDTKEKCVITLTVCARSFEREVRVNSLQIISAIKGYKDDDLVKLCLDYEKLSPTPPNIDSKMLILNKIAAILESSPIIEECVGSVLTSAIAAQMSVNLSPVWAVSDRILIKLLKTSHKTNWVAIKELILKCLSSYGSEGNDDKFGRLLESFDVSSKESSTNIPSYSEANMEVKSSKFYNLSIYLIHPKVVYTTMLSTAAVQRVLTDHQDMLLRRVFKVLETDELVKVDYKNCFCLLLRTMSHLSFIITENMNFFSEIFFDGVRHLSIASTASKKSPRSELNKLGGNLASKCVIEFLKMFSTISPKNIKEKDQLFNCYMHILTKGDEKLQEEALKCIFTYNINNCRPNLKVMLSSLCSEKLFRDTLTCLNVDLEIKQFFLSNVNEKLTTVIDVVIHILYGKLVSRYKRRSKSNIKSRRACIFSFLGCLDDYSITVLFKLMLKPFDQIKPFEIEFPFKYEEDLVLKLPDAKCLSGFIILLKEVIPKLKKKLDIVSRPIYKTLLYILASFKVTNKNDNNNRKVENKSFNCLIDLFRYQVGSDYGQFASAYFEYYLNDVIYGMSSKSKTSIMNLFSTWAHNEEYIPYMFDFNTTIIDKLVSMLGDPNTNLKLASSIMTILDSLTSLSPSSITSVAEYIDLIMSNVERFIKAVTSNKSSLKLKSTKNVLLLTFNVIRRLSNITNTSFTSSRAASALLPLLKHKNNTREETFIVEIIKIVTSYLPLIDHFKLDPTNNNPSPIGVDYYNAMSKMFITAKFTDTVKHLTEFFSSLALTWKFLEPVPSLVLLLNSQSLMSIDNRDYEKIFSAYHLINENYIDVLSPLQWLPIIYITFRDINCEEEFSIRISASDTLLHFISRVGSLVDEGYEVANEYMNVVKDTVFPGILRCLKSRSEKTRMCGVNLLGHLVLKIPKCELWNDLVILLYDNDPEMNFFANMSHLQIHRKARAISRLEEIAKRDPPPFTSRTVVRIIIPLLLGFIRETKVTSGSSSNLLDHCLKGITAVCPLLSEEHYIDLLKTFLTMLEKHNCEEGIIVRVLSHVTSGYCEDYYLKGFIPGKDKKKAVSYISRNVLPKLTNILYRDDHRTLVKRLPVARPVTQILKLLPKKQMVGALSKLSSFLSRTLCSKDNEIRQKVRQIMIEITNLIGPSIISTFLEDMEAVLVDGYQLHVLGYTMNCIITRAIPQISITELGWFIDKIIEVCISEIFDSVAEEKEVAELRVKMIETGTTKSYGTCEHLAMIVDIDRLKLFIDPIKKRMLEKHESKHSSKIAQYFQHLSKGISRNDIISSESIIAFSSQILSECLPFLNVKFNHNLESPNDDPSMNFDGIPKVNIEIYQANAYHLADFALALTGSVIKRLINVPQDVHLNSAIKNVIFSFHSSITSTVSAAARIINYIVNVEAPVIVQYVPLIIKRVLVIISRYPIEENIVQLSLRILATILRGIHANKVMEVQLRSLVNFLSVELVIKTPSKHTSTFSLIRAIAAMRNDLSEVSQLLHGVMELSINSPHPLTRSECIQCVVAFLCKPCILQKTLEKCILFYINNLDYKLETGRMSALEMLDIIVEKLKKEVFDDYFDVLLLALVVTLDNDLSYNCSQKARDIIKKMLKTSTQHQVTVVNTLIEKWVTQNEREDLQHASINLYTISADCIFDSTKKLIPLLAKVARELLDKAQHGDIPQEYKIFRWRLTAKILDMFIIVINHNSEVIMDKTYDTLWDRVRCLCLHPHNDIKIKSLNLISNLIESYIPQDDKSENKLRSNYIPSVIASSQSIDLLIDTILELVDSHDLIPAIVEKSADIIFSLTTMRMGNEPDYESLSSVFTRISQIVIKSDGGTKYQTFIMKYVNVFVEKMSSEGVQRVLDSLILILQRLCPDNADSDFTAKYRELCNSVNELRSKLQLKVGNKIYLAACQREKIQSDERKHRRRAESALMAVNNPEAASRRRLKNSLKRRRKQKEKIQLRALSNSVPPSIQAV